MYTGSPTAHEVSLDHSVPERWEHDRLGSSSPEPHDLPSRRSTTTRDGIKIPGIRRPSDSGMEYSGDDFAPYSDFSDTPPQSYNQPSINSFMRRNSKVASNDNTPYKASQQQPSTVRNTSQASGFHFDREEERVIWNGYLLCLKSKGGVKQWKRLWVVLRPKNLAIYKSDEVDNYLPTPNTT